MLQSSYRFHLRCSLESPLLPPSPGDFSFVADSRVWAVLCESTCCAFRKIEINFNVAGRGAALQLTCGCILPLTIHPVFPLLLRYLNSKRKKTKTDARRLARRNIVLLLVCINRISCGFVTSATAVLSRRSLRFCHVLYRYRTASTSPFELVRRLDNTRPLV